MPSRTLTPNFVKLTQIRFAANNARLVTRQKFKMANPYDLKSKYIKAHI